MSKKTSVSGMFILPGYCGVTDCYESHEIVEKIQVWANHTQYIALHGEDRYVFEMWMTNVYCD